MSHVSRKTPDSRSVNVTSSFFRSLFEKDNQSFAIIQETHLVLGSVDLDNLGNGPALTYSSVITRGTFFLCRSDAASINCCCFDSSGVKSAWSLPPVGFP